MGHSMRDLLTVLSYPEMQQGLRTGTHVSANHKMRFDCLWGFANCDQASMISLSIAHVWLQKELQLTAEVKQDLKLARRAYLTALSFIIKDRQAILRSLEANAPNGGNYCSTSIR